VVNYNDIAKYAKVSPTTVSHVINETRFVMPETKNKVLNAIKELKYQPNYLARSLAIGKTSIIGLVISDIRNPFYPDIIQGVEEVATKNDYDIFLACTDYDVKKELKSISSLLRKKIDGIILAADEIDDLVLYELLDTDVNLIFVDWGNRNMNFDSLHFDYQTGISESINYLISLGHEYIYFVSGPRKMRTSRVVINNFLNIIKKFNGNIKYKVLEGNYQLEGGMNAARKIMKDKEKPTAIMCANDLTAIGVMKFLAIEGLKIPEDVSIIGFDNIRFTEVVTPTLTTIALERYEIGKAAMELMIKRINNKILPKQTIVFKSKLIIRDSTANVKKL
jgi:DNA-binding LacI/PurR family transcriptional regulator